MKKGIVLAASFAVLFLGSMATAQAGSHVSFGFGFGVAPAVPYGYYYYPPYPPYYYQEYYYPGPVIYPGYGAYGYYNYGPRRVYAPRYYSNGRRYSYGRPSGNPRSRSGRWRY